MADNQMVKIEFDFDAIDRLAHKKLVKVGVVGFSLAKFNAVFREPFHEFFHPIAIKA
jgi:hypothetical protein